MKRKFVYLQFPLYMIRELYTDKASTINSMIKCGIYIFSQRNEPNPERVARQLIYDSYHNNLSVELSTVFDEFVENGMISCHDEYYKGFTGENGKFDPIFEADDIIKLFDEHPAFYDLAVDHYRLHAILTAAESLDINIDCTAENLCKDAIKTQRNADSKEPYPMVNKDLLFDYMENEKTEFELMQLTAYIAITSILGKKPFLKTNKALILSRMFGYSSSKTMPEKLPEPLYSLYLKYSNRYHFDKLIRQLQLNWNILTYAHHVRGIWIGKHDRNRNRDELLRHMIIKAETTKASNRIKELNQKKNEIRQEVHSSLLNFNTRP